MGLRTLARILASNFLDELGISPKIPLESVPLEAIAAALHVDVEYPLDDGSKHCDAVLWGPN